MNDTFQTVPEGMIPQGVVKPMHFRLHEATLENQRLRHRLSRLKRSLEHALEDISGTPGVKSTGWFVLLNHRADDGWEVIKCVNPDAMDESEIPEEWDMCIAIPDPATVPEFPGW